MIKIFIYGDLQKPKTLEKLFGREIIETFDSISNWIILNEFKKGEKYFQLVTEPGGVVFGKILELSDEEIEILDNYEKDYFRTQLKTDNDQIVDLYVLKEKS